MYRLSDAFPYLVNRVGVRIGELFSRKLEPYGVTLPMYRVMATLWETGDRRLGDLSAITGVELSTLSRLIGSMARKGLVSRRRPDHGRVVSINLTAKGRVLVEELIPLAKVYEDVGLRSFRPDQIAKLKRDLVRIFESLDEIDVVDAAPPARSPRRRAVARKPATSRARK